MRKRSPTIIKTFEELTKDYTKEQLLGALHSFKNLDLGWQILRAALMQEYLNTVVYSLDNASKTGKQIEAAYNAGSAQTMYDIANSVIDKYINVLEAKSGAVETPRPEE